jgi:surface antigen
MMLRRRIKTFGALLVLLPALTLAACESANFGEKTGLGAALGAAGGGLVGAAANGGTTGILAGVLLGGLAGGAIGNTLEQEDRRLALENSHVALERSRTGQTATWQNPDSGNSGTITPTRTFQTSDGTFCREYQQTITVGGREENGFGTACRQPDGNWQLRS